MSKCQPPISNDDGCRPMTDKQTHKDIHTFVLSKNRGNPFYLPPSISFSVFSL